MSDRPAPRYADNNCFVCSPTNPVGLQIEYHMEDGCCLGAFTPNDNHVGWDGVTHGGIIFSALDDVMANWLFLQGLTGHTARCDTRFREPLRVDTPVRIEGRLLSRRGRLAVLDGRMIRIADGALIAECEARFILSEPG